MRILGPLLVIASLVLGGGGVAYRTHADEVPAQFGMTPLQLPSADPVECRAPEPRRIELPRRSARARAVGLSARGYNYREMMARPSAPSVPASPR